MIQCSMHTLKILAFWEWVGVSSNVKCADLAVAANPGLPFWYHYFAPAAEVMFSRRVLSTADHQTCLLAWCARRVALVSWQLSDRGKSVQWTFLLVIFQKKDSMFKKESYLPMDVTIPIWCGCFVVFLVITWWVPGSRDWISYLLKKIGGCSARIQADFPPKCQVGFGNHPLNAENFKIFEQWK